VTFQKWMQYKGLSKASVNKYDTAVKGVISDWAQAADLLQGPLNSVESHTRFLKLSEQIRALEIFQQRNSIGKGMYSAALNKFAEYLQSNSENDVEDDLSSILDRSDSSETDKISAVKTRLGQGAFRQKLIGYWNGCAVTQYPDTALLVASHIKPWRYSSNEERLDPYNGLLLTPNLDTLFDSGMISFDENGKILISESLDPSALTALNVEHSLKLRSLSKETAQYLKYHREFIYQAR